MNSALVIIDLIEDYFDESIWPNSVIPSKRAALIDATNKLVDICRGAGIPVAWVRQEFSPEMSDAFLHARRAGMRYAIRGTHGTRLLDGLRTRQDDHELTKIRFSAFYETELDAWLEARRVSRLILSGITTAWCVRSTAVDAYQRDIDVLLAADCMAAFDHNSHVESLAAMDGYIAEALSNDQVLERLYK